MVSRQINIEFPRQLIQRYNESRYNLCFSIGVGESPAFNVIAKAENITSHVTIEWNDDFKIAATQDRFMNGVRIEVATDPVRILPGQVYTLPFTWVNGNITDGKLPEKSIKMVNDTAGEAAAVLYTRINGQDLPFYISNPSIDPKGSQVLTNKMIVALWIQADAETGTMVSVNKGDLSTFDLSSHDTLNLKLKGSHFVVA